MHPSVIRGFSASDLSRSELGGKSARGEHFEVRSEDIWSQSVLAAWFICKLERKKISPNHRLCRCMSVLLTNSRPLLAPQAARLSPTWSHSVLTTHSPVSLAQVFVFSPNVQVSLCSGAAQFDNSQRANTAEEINEMVFVGCTVSHQLRRTSQPGGEVLAALNHPNSSSGTCNHTFKAQKLKPL